MTRLGPQIGPQTDRDILESVAQACSWATPTTPVVLPSYHYAAIKRLAEVGDELAKEWLPRVHEPKPD